jgi:hypothetical protein
MTTPHFDPKISLGHILSLVSMIAAILVSWGVMTEKLTHLREAQLHQKARTEKVEDRTGQLETDSAMLKANISAINDGIQDLRQDLRLSRGTASR